MSDARETTEFCLVHPEKLNSPFEDYHYFRQNKPIFFHEATGNWFVFRYHDVDALFHDRRLSNQRMGGYVEGAIPEFRGAVERLFATYFRHWVLSLDDPEHRTLRQQLQPFFSERAVASWTPAITALCNELLDEAYPRGRMDFSREFAYQLPVRVICSVAGLPGDVRDKVLIWSDHLASYFNVVPPTPEISQAMVSSMDEMTAYLEQELQQRLGNPGDGLLGGLVQAGMPNHLIISNLMVLLVAGHETTRNLIGSALALLLRHPEQMQKVLDDPGLIPRLIDETLRYEPANPIMARAVAEDFEYAGHTFRKDQLVFLCIGSANRDPEFVENPDVFEVTRKPRKHMAFGSGPHFCLGSLLARKEASIALPAVLSRLPNLRADPESPPEWLCQAGMRGPAQLPIVWDTQVS
jgi:cytochrome P450